MRFLGAAVIVLVTGAALAQDHPHKHGQSPYAAMQGQAVKALSEQQIADLRAGRGMGLALSAELNGYPGPMHVLELAGPLNLTGAQRQSIEALYQSMQAEAIAVGERLIAAETTLDRGFKDRTMTPQRLAELSAAIGAIQGELRAAHLKYHLTTAELLTSDQSRRYADLRGYR